MLFKKKQNVIKFIVWVVAALFGLSLLSLTQFFSSKAKIQQQRTKQILKTVKQVPKNDENLPLIQFGNVVNLTIGQLLKVYNSLDVKVRERFKSLADYYTLAYKVALGKLEEHYLKEVKVDPKKVEKQINDIAKKYGGMELFKKQLERAGLTLEKFKESIAMRLKRDELISKIIKPYILSEDKIRDYYLKHIQEFKDKNGKILPLDKVSDKVAEILRKNFGEDKLKSFYEEFKYAFKDEDATLLADIFANIYDKARREKVEKQITEEMMKNYYENHKEDFKTQPKIKVAHILIKFKPEIQKVTDKDISDYYNKHKEDYKYDKAWDISQIYIMIGGKTNKDVQVTDKEIEDYYNLPARVKARHILVHTKAEADAIYNELKSIKDPKKLEEKFAQLAREKSFCPSAKKGGELGWFTPGMMVEPFEDAAFSLATDEISAPVHTRFGWHIILVEARQGKRYTEPLEKVKDKIREIIKRKKEAMKAQEVADNIYKQLNKDNFGAFAATYSDGASASNQGHIGKVYKGMQPKGSIVYKKYADEILEKGWLLNPVAKALSEVTKENTILKPIRTINGIHIIKVNKIYKEGYKTLDEVKDDIAQKVKEEKAEKQALADANKIYDFLKKGKKFDEMVKLYSQDSLTNKNGGVIGYLTKDQNMSDDFKGKVSKTGFVSKQLRDELFSLKQGEFTKPTKTDYGYSIFMVLEKIPASYEKFANVAEKVKEKLVQILAKKDAKETIDRAMKELNSGVKFEDVAKKYSDGVTAKDGGKLDYFTGNEMLFFIRDRKKVQLLQEIADGWKIADKVKEFMLYNPVGAVSNIIELKNGYHILKILDRKEGKLRKFDEVKEQLAKLIPVYVDSAQVEKYVQAYKARGYAGDLEKLRNQIRQYLLEQQKMKLYSIWLEAKAESLGKKVYYKNLKLLLSK